MPDFINVISLFDGKSCGQIALERAGVQVGTYYSSEIDKKATFIANKNYPCTIQLGDVLNWKDWDIDWSSIDLLIGGSPCQGFSVAGNGLNFKHEKSKLFFVFLDILEHVKKENPGVVFLLENVKMRKDWADVITDFMGVTPIEINSALVSAQNRRRLYWTNLTGIKQPEDKGIKLKDVLQDSKGLAESIMCEGWHKWWDRNWQTRTAKRYSVLDPEKAICLLARHYANWDGNFVTLDLEKYFSETEEPLVFRARNRKKVYISEDDIKSARTFYETRTELGKAARKQARIEGKGDTTPRGPEHKKYVASVHEKANCVLATRSFLDCVIDNNKILRQLTPIECERLQNVPDNYTSGVSNSARYKMLGNGWTVDVIAHFFEDLEQQIKDRQLVKELL